MLPSVAQGAIIGPIVEIVTTSPPLPGRMRAVYCTLILMLALPARAGAQAPAAPDQAARVEIRNTKDPELRSYAQMLRGMRAYRDKLALAPHSVLYFILIPKSPRVRLEDVTMRLASDTTSLPIPIGADGKFQLPLIDMQRDDEYDLILNRPKGEFLIRPYVASPGLPANTERLGDLRLECAVRWAVEKQDVSVVFRTYVKLLSADDPCTSRTVAVGFYAPDGMDTVTLAAPGQDLVQKLRPYEAYSLPIWNTEIGDEALVHFGRTAALTAHPP